MKTKQILMTGALALSMVLSDRMFKFFNKRHKDNRSCQEKRSKNNWTKKQGFKIFEDDKQYRKENHSI